jgi:drug/metabolite transporter (DMT)-like permease
MNRKVKAEIALAVCSLLWGATFVVVRDALQHVSVLLFLAVRFGLAAVLMAVFRPSSLRGLSRDEWVAGAALGLFMFGGYAFQTAGLQYTTPAKSAFVTGSSVVLVPLLLGIFWKRRLTLWVYVGTLAAVAGLYLLTVPEAVGAGLARLNRGDLLTLVAAALYAVHIILVSEYARRHSSASLSVLQVGSCAGMALVATVFASLTKFEPTRWDWTAQSLIGIAICAVFATAIAFGVQMWGQRYTTPSHAAIIYTLEPVFAVGTSYLVIGERLGGRSMVGAIFVLAGILIAELLGPAAAPESPEPMGEIAV